MCVTAKTNVTAQQLAATKSVCIVVLCPITTVSTLSHLKVNACKNFTRKNNSFFKLQNSKYLVTQKELLRMQANAQIKLYASAM